ncbi:ATP-grasp domain-containing protein [Diplocloster agilis]|uniref:ATP-grasp domain-containing protein n=1 Tax=Diplocloster agilis TaxID=2850323 RepID=A0A949NE04_9FIRM|nr:ATP-grasp domain-containing protein [Suonthocola fibrivorans]MBU9736576.1 ATP-grasp domain-containing protein [Diplocloster agilis]MCU6735180.1 ATP-grasp domain-containing protein [Suonthocola fibrivorans]SCJ66503.1 Alanine-anticapsin ligase BacD [uncultured Clostridium sp.]
MKKIVIIGANSFQNRLILEAKRLGYETHVFAWKCGDVGEYTADFFYPISIVEKEKILEISKKINPVAVVAIASDLASLTANYLARHLGLIANSEECDQLSTNKYLMRQAFLNAGIPTPNFVCINSKDIDLKRDIRGLQLPLIIKPTDRSGSRAITRVDDIIDIPIAVNNAINQSFENAAIVEEYIDGEEYSCECISFNGKHSVLAFTKKFTTGEPNYIEVGHIQPASLSYKLIEKITVQIYAALDALKIKYGASHSEFKITPQGNIRIIEIGARMGGDCIGSDLVKLSTGNNFLELVINVACGIEPVIKRQQLGFAGIKFFMNMADIIAFNSFKNKYQDMIFYESPLKIYDKVVDSSSRLGYFIVHGNNLSDVMNIF